VNMVGRSLYIVFMPGGVQDDVVESTTHKWHMDKQTMRVPGGH